MIIAEPIDDFAALMIGLLTMRFKAWPGLSIPHVIIQTGGEQPLRVDDEPEGGYSQGDANDELIDHTNAPLLEGGCYACRLASPISAQ